MVHDQFVYYLANMIYGINGMSVLFNKESIEYNHNSYLELLKVSATMKNIRTDHLDNYLPSECDATTSHEIQFIKEKMGVVSTMEQIIINIFWTF